MSTFSASAAAKVYYTDSDGESQRHDRLGFTFCLALALHAALILGISFSKAERTQAAPKLEITLAQHKSQQTPEEADYLAQSDQLGSGTLEEKAMLTTKELADFQDTAINPVSEQQQLNSQSLQLAKEAVVTTSTENDQQDLKQQQDDQQQLEDLQSDDKLTVINRHLEIASLEAKLDIQKHAYAKRPRIRRLTSVATKQSDDALYLHNWRTKVELIGNQHYPEKAKQKNLFGDLRLVVSLLPNGTVHKVKVLKSSGINILDQAAISIVHLAAPYDPFPKAMNREVDVLEIIRTWRFHEGTLTSST